jgi:hypothetical protein
VQDQDHAGWRASGTQARITLCAST